LGQISLFGGATGGEAEFWGDADVGEDAGGGALAQPTSRDATTRARTNFAYFKAHLPKNPSGEQ